MNRETTLIPYIISGSQKKTNPAVSSSLADDGIDTIMRITISPCGTDGYGEAKNRRFFYISVQFLSMYLCNFPGAW